MDILNRSNALQAMQNDPNYMLLYTGNDYALVVAAYRLANQLGDIENKLPDNVITKDNVDKALEIVKDELNEELKGLKDQLTQSVNDSIKELKSIDDTYNSITPLPANAASLDYMSVMTYDGLERADVLNGVEGFKYTIQGPLVDGSRSPVLAVDASGVPQSWDNTLLNKIGSDYAVNLDKVTATELNKDDQNTSVPMNKVNKFAVDLVRYKPVNSKYALILLKDNYSKITVSNLNPARNSYFWLNFGQNYPVATTNAGQLRYSSPSEQLAEKLQDDPIKGNYLLQIRLATPDSNTDQQPVDLSKPFQLENNDVVDLSKFNGHNCIEIQLLDGRIILVISTQ